MAPEQLAGVNYDKSVDWWATGIMLYELLYGFHPFNKEDDDLTNAELIDKVNKTKLTFPNQQNTDANDLISKLLDKSPAKRLNHTNIKQHTWFTNVNWDSIIKQEPVAKLKPQIKVDLTDKNTIYEEL